MASFSEEDILLICDQIFEKLGVNYELEDLGILLEENIYIELYRIMFPYLESILLEIASKKTKTGQKIQDLIDLLSSTILNMDLSHIKGENIAKGDKKHILNFLQLLFEVIKLLPTPNNKEVAIRSAPLSDKSSQMNTSNRRRTVQGILDEFPSVNLEQEIHENEENPPNEDVEEGVEELQGNENDGQYMQDLEGDYNYSGEIETNTKELQNDHEKDPQQEEEEQHDEEQMVEELIGGENSKNIIKEAPKSEESSEYDKYGNKGGKIDKNKPSGKVSSKKKENFEKNEKKMQRDKSKKNLVDNLHSQKEIHKKLIGESLFPNQGKTKILHPEPNLINTVKLKRDSHNQSKGSQEKEGLLENSANLEQKNSKQSSKMVDHNAEFLKFNENMYEILADNIEKIRESLRNMKKTNLSEEDLKTKEQLIRQKNEYKRLLKEYLQYHKGKEKTIKNKSEKDEKFFIKKIQNMQSKDSAFNQIIENEEKGLYMKLRDEKINYLRKIHRIIFELEKRKIIDENKMYKDNRKLRNEETRYMLESIENAYKDKINMMKEKIVAQRQEKAISETAHRQVLSKLERELKNEKKKQLNELKDAWRCEKEKFDLLVMDDGKLEQKIMELYNKY